MASDSDSTIITEDGSPSLGLEEVITSVKKFESADLFKLLKVVISVTEKKAKIAAKSTPKGTTRASKKTGSMPKGTLPPQFKKPRAWLEYTHKDILENGWEPFTVIHKNKNKVTKEVIEQQIEMPGSILHDGPDGSIHIFSGSITEKTPNGKQPIPKDAMSISKQRKESGHPSYSLFEASYVATSTAPLAAESSNDDKSVTDAVPSAGDEVPEPVTKKMPTKKTPVAKKPVSESEAPIPKKIIKKKTSTTVDSK